MLKEYISFTKGERVAIISLVVLMIVLAILPSVIHVEDPPSWKEISLLPPETVPSAGKSYDEPVSTVDTAGSIPVKSGTLFYFDPNTLSVPGWVKLGVSERSAKTIQKYLSKGGRFRQPDDLRKIYGLGEELKERLLPFIRIEDQRTFSPGDQREEKEVLPDNRNPGAAVPASRPVYTTVNKPPIDVNRADSLQWVSLPGIGPRLAGRILRFREALGGFVTVAQVGETFGLADSVFHQISERLKCPVATVRKININIADKQLLAAHPYIRYRRAEMIIRYRQEHGPINNLRTIQNLDLWTAEEWKKLEPYLETSVGTGERE